MTSVLDGVSVKLHILVALPLGNEILLPNEPVVGASKIGLDAFNKT